MPGVVLPEVAVGARASVRVPATSANLGPGYDALGLALAWYDDVSVEVIAEGLTFDIHGEGVDTAPRDDSHLVVTALRTALRELGVGAPGLALSSTNRIPHGRGLGSSAAAICAGVLLARALAGQAPGDRPDEPAGWALDCATRLEGHPDNVAPCLLGGLTIAWTTPLPDGAAVARAVALPTVAQLQPVVLVPPFASSTVHARGLLPAQVPHADAAFNTARAALLIAGLTTRPEVVFDATEDRLHQPYRAPAMPAAAELVTRLRAAGVAAVISGAGPTVLVLSTSDACAADALATVPAGWRALAVPVDRSGATLTS